MRTFVFGDIHGCFIPLEKLLNISFEKYNFSKDHDKFLFIGDYVDRGTESKKVINRLIKLKEDYCNTVFLRGNHEDMFINYLGFGGCFGEYFIMNGGSSTLFSYGLDDMPNTNEMRKMSERKQQEWERKISKISEIEMINKIPKNHIDFLLSTEYYHDTEKILFVHAGVNPHKTLNENVPFDFTWVSDDRARFFRDIERKPWEKMLVHGHTPIRYNEVLKFVNKNRINVDTGLVFGERLTMLIIEETKKSEEWEVVQSDYDNIYY